MRKFFKDEDLEINSEEEKELVGNTNSTSLAEVEISNIKENNRETTQKTIELNANSYCEEKENEYEQGNEYEEPEDADVENPNYHQYDENEEDNQNQINNNLENDDEEYEIDDYKNPRQNGLSEDENN